VHKLFPLLAVLAVLTCAAAYVAGPLIAAVRLRHAIATGDAPTVDRMIEWQPFRESLRYSIARNAKLVPAATDAARADRPTIWQRIRSLFGYSMLDRFIEHYITPQGLTRLYQAKLRQSRVKQTTPALAKAGVTFDQIRSTWARVRRAEFVSPSRFVLELDDATEPSRRIRGFFILDGLGWYGFQWKLRAVAIDESPPRSAPPAGPGTAS
jgi:hypothetical protein